MPTTPALTHHSKVENIFDFRTQKISCFFYIITCFAFVRLHHLGLYDFIHILTQGRWGSCVPAIFLLSTTTYIILDHRLYIYRLVLDPCRLIFVVHSCFVKYHQNGKSHSQLKNFRYDLIKNFKVPLSNRFQLPNFWLS